MTPIYLFFGKAINYRYSEPLSITEVLYSEHKVIYLPLNIDTEFYHHRLNLINPVGSAEIQRTLTVQVRGIEDPQGEIYTHPDSADIARHPVDYSPLSICNYLHSRNIPLEFVRNTENIRCDRYIRVSFHGFFLLAEYLRIAQGQMRNDLEQLTIKPERNKIEQGRRLIASNKSRGGNLEEQFIYLNRYLLYIDGIRFGLQIEFFDYSAMTGNGGLDNFAKIGGHELKFKDTLELSDKENMRDTYLNKPEEFDNYALGDLEVYDIAIKVDDLIGGMYRDTGNAHHYKQGESSRLTIGATVAKFFEASLMTALNISDLKLLHSLTKPGTAETIKESNETSKYNAKVDGGRCRNNRPTDVRTEGLICDIDISGCYGEGLRAQEYPLGNPVQIGYPIKSDINEYKTLGQFLNKYGHELIPGLWSVRISTKPGYKLKYKQDFFTSWFPPKNLDKLPTDSDLESIEWWTEDNVGTTKILRNEINLAVFQHDGLKWLDNVASPRQRREILDNTLVISAIYYPKSCRVNNLDELLAAQKNHKGKNTCTPKGKGKNTKIVKVEQECHAWFSVNLGDALITELLKKRNEYPSKTPLNILHKLFINTVYGDQVSPYFPIGNTCVGNNITARARAMAWYMEKGLHGFQTITDGCAFEIERVPYPEKNRLTSETLLDAHSKGTHNGNFKFKSLITEYSDENKLIEVLPVLILEKLRADFPSVDVLHQATKSWKGEDRIGQFELAVKDLKDGIPTLFKGIATNGSANYWLVHRESPTTAKYRSWSTKPHEIIESNLVVNIMNSKPAQEFLENIYRNPEAVPRSKCIKTKRILKTGTYKAMYSTIGENSKLFPGCTVEGVRIIRECPLATFTFDTMEQFKSWEREQKKLIAKTGQSYESFYLNPDGTLNYVKMIREIDALIQAGKMSYLGGKLSRYLSGELEGLQRHPAFDEYLAAKEAYAKIYGYEIPEDETGDDELV